MRPCTKLPRMRAIDADWRLGVAATGLDRATGKCCWPTATKPLRQVADRDRRPVPAVVQSGRGQAEGLFTLRTSDDAARVAGSEGPAGRVLIVGAGFIGSEMASVCRDLGLDVTVAGEPAHRWSVRSAV